MDVLVRSQLNSIVQSYIGKQLMIVVPSQCVRQEVDAEERTNHLAINSQKICRLGANNQVVLGLPYSYTTGRDWSRHHIHGLVDDEPFGMELICWSPDRIDDLQAVAAWYVQKIGVRQVLFISLKGETKIWNYENNRITGHVTLGSFQAEHIVIYGQMLLDSSQRTDEVYVCKSIADDYRLVRAPHCDRSNLENFGQLSNHLGSDHILLVPEIQCQVHGHTMQQYLALLDVPYNKVYHSFGSDECASYCVLYVRHHKLKAVLDMFVLLYCTEFSQPLFYVTPEGNFYELGSAMRIRSNLGVFSMENYIKAHLQLGKADLHVRFDNAFRYNRPSIFMRMGSKIILNRLLNS